MDARAGLVSGSIAFASRATSQLCMLAVTIVATRTLSIGDFGAFALASAAMVLSRNLFYVGPYEYLLKTADSSGLRANCLAANLILASASMLLVLVFAACSARLFDTGLVGSLLAFLTPSIVGAAGTAWFEAMLLREQRMRSYYVTAMAGELAGSGLAIALLVAGLGPYGLIAQVYGRIAVVLAIYLVIGRFRHVGRPDWTHTKEVLAWSRLRYTSTFLNFGANYGADFILGIVLSPAASGLYRASSRIVMGVADLFAQPLLKIAQTNVSARFAAGAGTGGAWLTMFAGVALFAWGALAFLAAFSGDIIAVVLGEKWRAAAPIVSVLCLVRAVALLDSATIPVLVCANRKRFILSAQTAAALSTLAASVVLAPFGPKAVAIGVGIVLVSVSLVYVRIASRISSMSFTQLGEALTPALLPAALATGCGMAVNAAISAPSVPLLAITGTAALVGFATGLFVVRGQALGSLAALSGKPVPVPAE
jgi:O-antigen/teichoic acid export membrane protein